MIEPVFKIISTERTEDSIVTILEIDADSDILKGHFPDQPVVPGACMLQTVKEILEDNFKASLRLVKADNIKFLNLIEPQVGNLTLTINHQLIDEQLKITVNLSSADSICMKFKGTFEIRSKQ
jgi:3-hydroxyacyl-[acyl-carrier-protein] dehydratase